MRHREVTDVIESLAPVRRQESYDNTGYQCGDPDGECRGVLLCVDLTPEIVSEAVARGCNLVITHHPLLFRATKCIVPEDRVGKSVIAAISNGVTVYSCHTAIDNTAGTGVSFEDARALGLLDVSPLVTGAQADMQCGAVGRLANEMTPEEFVAHVKRVFGSGVARCSARPSWLRGVSRVALCGGAGADFIGDAIAAGAEVYVTSDCKHNHFIDNCDRIWLIDIGHYESEACTKRIFHDAIRKKMPNFAVYMSEVEKNPINYL